MTQEQDTVRRPDRVGRAVVAVVATVAVLLVVLAVALGRGGTPRGGSLAGQSASAPTSRAGAPAGSPRVDVRPAAAFADPGTETTSPSPTPTPSAPDPSPTPTADTTSPPASATLPPTSAPDPSPTPQDTGSATTTPDGASPAPTPAPSAVGLHGGPTALAALGDPGSSPTYLPAGRPLTGMLPFQLFRVVVQLSNGGPGDVTVTPRLEYRTEGGADFRAVPEEATPGIPLHSAQEWETAGTGTVASPETTTAAASDARLEVPTGMTAAAGHRASGVNPAPPVTLAAGSVTEQEFTVALSVDAPYGATFELRVTDGGAVVDGSVTAVVGVGAAPPTLQSPGQRAGSPVPGSSGTAGDATAAALLGYPLVGPSTTTAASATSSALLSPSTRSTLSTATTTVALLAGTSDPALLAAEPSAAAPADDTYLTTVGPAGPATVHDPYSSTQSGQCGVCHEAHTAAAPALVSAPTITGQCYSCHAGGVGGPDVQAQYTLGQPANDPATRSYWSHDTSDATGHLLDSADEFGGKLNRHSQCTDCHDPHGTTSDPATMTPDGWTAPGGLANTSGVAVTNGAAGTTPTYTLLDGTVAPVTAEYQLCFKCHSGYTTLPADVPDKPSQNASDLAVALNPANPSYHPIEAPGRNQTQKLADSLAGTSPYKLWTFGTGDTVRCVSCHASNTTGTSSDPAQNAPGATLTVHASTNRGILTRPYENRVLSAAGQFYDNAGFALCLTCHMETPYMNRYRPAAAEGTNFVFHGLHMSGITSKGSGGLDIDTPGAGQGNARCAECHFDNHGTTEPPTTQKLSGDRLVVFAPDVLPSRSMGGVPTFTKTATGGTCTLTCHGKDHQGAAYTS